MGDRLTFVKRDYWWFMRLIGSGKPDLVSLDVVDGKLLPNICPKCKEGSYLVTMPPGSLREVHGLEGPYYRYRKRESEAFFDLEKKYLICINCLQEIEVMDYQVIVEHLSSKLPPEHARSFAMKSMHQYYLDPEKMKSVLLLIVDDFEHPDNNIPLRDPENVSMILSLLSTGQHADS
jgi:hypothetical protein